MPMRLFLVALTTTTLLAAACSGGPAPAPRRPARAVDERPFAGPADPVASAMKSGKEMIRSGRFQAALVFFNMMAKRHAKDPRPYYYVGVCLVNLRQPAKAVVAYRAAIKRLGSGRKLRFFALWHNYGAALLEVGNTAEAIPALVKASKMKPTDGSVWFNLGLAYGEARKLPEAARAFEKALGVNPRHLNSRRALTEVLKQLERYELALKHLKELSNQLLGAGASAKLRLRLTLQHALLYARLKNEKQALAALSSADKLAPKTARVLFARGMVYLHLGKAGQAITALRPALALKPNQPALLLALGRAQLAAKQNSAAIATIKRAQVAAKGRLKSAPFYLAEAHRQAGRCPTAKPLYLKVLKSIRNGRLATAARAGLKACP